MWRQNRSTGEPCASESRSWDQSIPKQRERLIALLHAMGLHEKAVQPGKAQSEA